MKNPLETEKDENSLEVLRKLLGGAPAERKLHYTFAYEGLPQQFFAGSELMWPHFKQADKNEALLRKLWVIIGQISKLEALEPEGLKVDYLERDRFEIFALTMPPPQYVPEAYYCIIIKHINRPEFKYYTVEYANGGTTFLGQVLNDGSRESMGEIKEHSLEACLENILQLQA